MDSEHANHISLEQQPQDLIDNQCSNVDIHIQASDGLEKQTMKKKKNKNKKRKAKTFNQCIDNHSTATQQIDQQMLLIYQQADKHLPVEDLYMQKQISIDPMTANLIYNEYLFEKEVQRRGMLIRRACSLVANAAPLLANGDPQLLAPLIASLIFGSPSECQRDQTGSS